MCLTKQAIKKEQTMLMVLSAKKKNKSGGGVEGEVGRNGGLWEW